MKKFILFFLLSFFFTSGLYAQSLDTTLEKYALTMAPERAYIHFDKTTYGAGETIWFKAYLMEGFSPAVESKTFYIDWTDDRGNLLQHTVSPLQGATTNGQFDIPPKYSGSFIHVKAYTKWMLNFDTAFFYEKDIRIISDYVSPFQNTSLQTTLGFYPEGGDMVRGVNNKIAFKARDQFGRPVKISGVIQNQKGDIKTTLKILHDGMGYFNLLPNSGESFVAVWKDANGSKHTTALPAVRESGIAVQITLQGDKRKFFIKANPAAAEKIKNVRLLGTMNSFRVFEVQRNLDNGTTEGVIPVQNLPSGILTISVFDGQWNLLAERITFINNEEYQFPAAMEVTHWGLNKRARNEIELTVPDSVEANFSIAVTDASIDTDSSDNIISHFLLSAELRGQIFNPAYYFSSNDDSVSQNLDLVMLTNGWRRINWDAITNGNLPAIQYPKDTAYLSLSGKIYGVLPSQLGVAPHIILIVSGNQQEKKGNQMLYVPIQKDGTFNDQSVFLFDTAHVFYQLSKGLEDASVHFMENKLPARTNRIEANGKYFNKIEDTTGYARHKKYAEELRQILIEAQGKLLENVILKTKTKSPVDQLDERYTTGFFSGDGYKFDLVHDPLAGAAPNIFAYLQGKIAGLNISGTAPNINLQWRGNTPVVLIDEIPSDVSFLSSIDIKNVAYVKVMRPPFLGLPGATGGAIAIYTRKGNDIPNEPGKGLANNKVSGYSLIRQFYSPDYSSFVEANEKKDNRTTLYWNPQVIFANGKHQQTVTFYNNDITDAFRVIIEGMSSDGHLVHIEQLME